MNKKNYLLFVVTVFSIGGCSVMGPIQNPTPVLPEISESIPVPAAFIDKGKLRSCSEISRTIIDNGIPSELLQFSIMNQCIASMVDENGNVSSEFSNWQKIYVRKGISLSNAACSTFIRDLQYRRRGAQYAQNNVGIIGTALTASLAFSPDHTRALFNTAVGLTAINSWFANYKETFVLAPNLSVLQYKLETELREPIATTITTKAEAGGYPDPSSVNSDLRKYDALCSIEKLQDIIDKTLTETKVVSDAEKQGNAKAGEGTDSEKALQIIKGLYAKSVKSQDPDSVASTFTLPMFQYLYVIATPSPSYKIDEMKAPVAAALPALQPAIDVLFSKENAAVVVPAIQSAGKLLGFESLQSIQSLRGLIEKQVELAKNPPSVVAPAASRFVAPVPALRGAVPGKPLTPAEVIGSEETEKNNQEVEKAAVAKQKWDAARTANMSAIKDFSQQSIPLKTGSISGAVKFGYTITPQK